VSLTQDHLCAEKLTGKFCSPLGKQEEKRNGILNEAFEFYLNIPQGTKRVIYACIWECKVSLD